MNIHDATEQAYKNGYDAGYRAATKERTAKWIISSDGYYPYCSNCRREPTRGVLTEHCPCCGYKMIGTG